MCIKTWVTKHLKKFTGTCNGDVIRRMNNEELAHLIAIAMMRHNPLLGEDTLHKEEQKLKEWLDKEI